MYARVGELISVQIMQSQYKKTPPYTKYFYRNVQGTKVVQSKHSTGVKVRILVQFLFINKSTREYF